MNSIGIGCGELYPFFLLLFKTYQTFLFAVAIYKFLSYHCAQPAFERPTPHVEAQTGDAPAVALGSAVEVAVDGVSEVAGLGILFGDPAGNVVELFAKARKERGPGEIVAGGAGMGQGQLFQPEFLPELH